MPSSIAISSKFSTANRLLRTDGFDSVVCAENVADKYFKIYFIRNGKNLGRLGIIASKRTLPSAAQRNRAKRIIREAFRKHKIKLCKLDLVVMVRRDYSLKAGAQVYNLEKLFSQVESRCAEY